MTEAQPPESPEPWYERWRAKPVVAAGIVFVAVMAALTVIKDFVNGTWPWLISFFEPVGDAIASVHPSAWAAVFAAMATYFLIASFRDKVRVELARKEIRRLKSELHDHPPDPSPDPVAEQAADDIRTERRAALRDVKETLTGAMTHSGADREHGDPDRRDAAMAAANRANSVVQEIADEEGQELVGAWKELFDAIPKGWKNGGFTDMWGDGPREPAGYPEPAWGELRRASDAANARLGFLIRRLQGDESTAP